MTSSAPAIEPIRAEQLRAIQELYDDGLALQAYERGRAHGRLEQWLPA